MIPSLENPDYHHKQKGCRVVARRQPGVSKRTFVDGFYCLTHKVELCRCGFTWPHRYEQKEDATVR